MPRTVSKGLNKNFIFQLNTTLISTQDIQNQKKKKQNKNLYTFVFDITTMAQSIYFNVFCFFFFIFHGQHISPIERTMLSRKAFDF